GPGREADCAGRCQHCNAPARSGKSSSTRLVIFGPGRLLPSGRSKNLILTHARYLESGPSISGVTEGKAFTRARVLIPVTLLVAKKPHIQLNGCRHGGDQTFRRRFPSLHSMKPFSRRS